MLSEGVIEVLKKELSIFQLIVVSLVVIVLVNLLLRSIKAKMLKRATSKIQISNIKFFFRVIQVVIILIVATVAIFYHRGSWTGLGIFAGLLSAALGFALQKPITGIAAWLVIIIRRPFNIGDRIKIGTFKGEVYDITLTHLYLDEVGGDVDTEDYSGRNIIVPNHLLFDNNIINYTLLDDFVLAEVATQVTYESDIDEAMKVIGQSTKKFAEQFVLKDKREIKLRFFMEPSSMTIKARFYAPVKNMSRIKSDIAEEIYKRIKNNPKVHIAYPHTQFVMKKEEDFPILEKDKSQKKENKNKKRK
jgi:small-conductance mechanosensitive channel